MQQYYEHTPWEKGKDGSRVNSQGFERHDGQEVVKSELGTLVLSAPS